jgi:hypothetical protein
VLESLQNTQLLLFGDFLAIATLPVNMGQAIPLTIVRAEKSYYIIRVLRSLFSEVGP